MCKLNPLWAALTLCCALALSLALAACDKPQRTDTGKIKAVATIFAYYDILRAVGGSHVDAVILIPPKTTPHEFDPSIQTRTEVSQAKLIVKNGLMLDDWVDKLAQGNRDAKIINIAQQISAKPLNTAEVALDTPSTANATQHKDEHKDEPKDAHKEDHHEHGAGNPHIWLDPTIQIQAAGLIRDALIQIDPRNGEAYKYNAAEYIRSLQQLDADFQTAVAKFATKEFIGFHSAYDYLAQRYGLKQIAALEEYPEQGVTVAQAQRIIALIKDKNIKVLFTESALPSKDADLIVRQTGVKLAVLQPLETYDNVSDTYLSLMRQNLTNLHDALGK